MMEDYPKEPIFEEEEAPLEELKKKKRSSFFEGAGPVLSRLLAGLAPVAIGYAMGGKEGAAIGAGVGSEYLGKESLKDYQTEQEKKRREGGMEKLMFSHQLAQALGEAKAARELEKTKSIQEEIGRREGMKEAGRMERAKLRASKGSKITDEEKLNLYRQKKEIDKTYQGEKEKEKQRLTGVDPRLKNDTSKKSFDYSLLNLQAIDDMEKALQAGVNTFSIVGDNPFTAARIRAAEYFGRAQSGGAINKEEEDRFIKMLPTYKDTREIQTLKLQKAREAAYAKLKTLGFSPEEIQKRIPQSSQRAQKSVDDMSDEEVERLHRQVTGE